MKRKPIRWHAEFYYKKQGRPMKITCRLIDIETIRLIMDAGPPWDCISEIKIAREHLLGKKFWTTKKNSGL